MASAAESRTKAAALGPVTRGESLSERAYATLRRAIRDATLVRDEIYSDGELAGMLGTSRTPVREAVRRLALEGLVEVLPQRGFRLREISAEDVQEIFGLREAIECHVVERLAVEISAESLAELRTLSDRQRAALDDPQSFLETDEAFHLAITAAAGLDRAAGMLSILRGAMWLIGGVALSRVGRPSQVIEEHARIVDAIEGRDPEVARRAMAEHLQNSYAAARQLSPLEPPERT
jgi:DNA-binding GntR family transcriptional regulator